MVGDYLIFGGIAVTVVGLLILLLALVLSLRERGAQVKKGAVIVVGPVPIVIADDPQTAKSLMALALLLMVASVAIFLLLSTVH